MHDKTTHRQRLGQLLLEPQPVGDEVAVNGRQKLAEAGTDVEHTPQVQLVACSTTMIMMMMTMTTTTVMMMLVTIGRVTCSTWWP